MTPLTPAACTPAGRALRRARRLDRLASVVIALGGLGVMASVAGILVFIAAEAIPLFREARVAVAGTQAMAVADRPSRPDRDAFGLDEHGRYLYRVGADGRLRIWRREDGGLLHDAAVPGLGQARVTASSRAVTADLLAVGTADGRVAVVHLRPTPRSSDPVSLEVVPCALVTLGPSGHPVREVSAREADGLLTVAGLAGDAVVLAWWRDGSGRERSAELGASAGERFRTVQVGHPGEVAAGTESGRVLMWRLGPEEPSQTRALSAGARPVTALAWLLGERTLLVGDADGGVSGWFDARTPGEADEPAMVEGGRFARHGSSVAAIIPSGRDRRFLTTAEDGSVVLHHATSRVSTALRAPRPGGAPAAAFAPRASEVLVDAEDGTLTRYLLDDPHPEATPATLFGRVGYEGYPQPAFVWQSSGASDEFEPKLSLVPLAFGTLKAACYALLFAVPLALLGALYTSQFVHPRVRARLKPTVEFMAALPTVVVGLVAGLWLAAFVERHLASVLLGMPFAVAAGTAGLLVWTWGVPRALRGRATAGAELLAIVPMMLLGLTVAFAVGPWVERLCFGGDLRLWLNDLGFTYDQRNGLVVGLAMGFAVIPVIYTIAEDAFASVPRSLTAASAALGASRWQTAWRVVVPTAGAGVVSAVMVGFGRAVGETMIVLMVSGNSPLMDWSIFNGLRTLSATIAIEAPEAPAGSTLYRVLFLSAALLFVVTFAANTVAELLRQRLRDRYKAL